MKLALDRHAERVVLTIGDRTAIMTLGEWSRLISSPDHV